MLGDVDRRAAILAAERKALDETQRNQHDRRRDAPLRVGWQDADEERPDAHQGHGDEERVLAPDDVADAAEHQGTQGTHGEACGEGEQREDEGNVGRNIGEEILGEKYAERSVDVEVVPLENGAQR